MDLIADRADSSSSSSSSSSMPGRLRNVWKTSKGWLRSRPRTGRFEARTQRLDNVSRRLSTTTSYAEYGDKNKIFYVTTPIFYVNAGPHIGHLYSAILADSITRYRSMLGHETYLSTGTDEHGNKVQNAATAANLPVQQYCDEISFQFREMCDRFDVRYSSFIRTTDEKHRAALEEFWKTLKSSDHVYLGKYSGWYCVPDESFVPSSELVEKKSPTGETIRLSKDSGHPVEWTEEENYKFRLSAFQNDLKYWLKNADSVQPAKYHKILSDWIEEGSCLADLSISRPAKRAPWGVPVPDDDSHTIYVWLDALVNYLTSVGYPRKESLDRFWPPSVQVIGKDILKFHGVYWPAFLMAAGLEPPRSILCHSHWTVDDEKMSKSKGNVVSPFEAAREFTADGLRYFLLREAVPHSDANYSNIKIRKILNSELADTFGNLVSRCMAKSINPLGEIVDPSLHAETLKSESGELLVESLRSLGERASASYEELNLHRVTDCAMETLHAANRMVDHHKPWELRRACRASRENDATTPPESIELEAVLSLALEACRITALVLLPIIPGLSSNFLNYLNVPREQRNWSNTKFPNEPRRGTRGVNTSGSGAILFPRIRIADGNKS